MKKLTFLTVALLLTVAFSFGQTANPLNLNWNPGNYSGTRTLDPDLFLQGDYVDLGIEAAGSCGTLIDPPGGYHFFPINPGGLGFVADYNLDGWATGTPTNSGDYFLPGYPWEGWLVEFTFGGNEATFKNCGALGLYQVPQTSLVDNSAGTNNAATWTGTATGLGQSLMVQQYFHFLDSDGKFFIDVTLTNTGTDPLESVEYSRAVDPDQEVNLGDYNDATGYITSNYVSSQPSGSNTLAEVRSFGITYGVPMALQLNHANAKAHVIPSNLEIFSPDEPLDATFAPTSGAPYVADVGVAVAVRFPVLNPGQSVNFTVVYLLNEREVSEVPLSNWALALMIGLIAIFTIIRFRKMN
jgi:hypothetical protein